MFVKNKQALDTMRTAGKLLAEIFDKVGSIVQEGTSTAAASQQPAQERTTPTPGTTKGKEVVGTEQ